MFKYTELELKKREFFLKKVQKLGYKVWKWREGGGC